MPLAAFALLSDGSSDVDALAVTQAAADGFELHHTIGERKKGVVLAFADVDAGQHGGAALTDQDRTGGHTFAAVSLHTKALGIGIATVAR